MRMILILLAALLSGSGQADLKCNNGVCPKLPEAEKAVKEAQESGGYVPKNVQNYVKEMHSPRVPVVVRKGGPSVPDEPTITASDVPQQNVIEYPVKAPEPEKPPAK